MEPSSASDVNGVDIDLQKQLPVRARPCAANTLPACAVLVVVDTHEVWMVLRAERLFQTSGSIEYDDWTSRMCLVGPGSRHTIIFQVVPASRAPRAQPAASLDACLRARSQAFGALLSSTTSCPRCIFDDREGLGARPALALYTATRLLLEELERRSARAVNGRRYRVLGCGPRL